MPSQSGRGRPPTFTPEQREQFAQLIKLHGALRTHAISSIPISRATLLKIAHEFGIPLKHGRRRRAA